MPLAGGLFTRDFLMEGIRETDTWNALDTSRLTAVKDALAEHFSQFAKHKAPNEAETEVELIWPVLEAIGWSALSVQQNLSAKRRDDVPDALLFADLETKSKSVPLDTWQRFQHGLCIVEAKRWNRVLDREDGRHAADGVPSTQMLRYLRRVDDVTNGGLRWGILTNGRHWRLYFKGAISVAEDFLELDLGKVLDLPGCPLDLLDKRPEGFGDDAGWRLHLLKLFVLLFGRSAFVPDHHGETFHQLALRQGRQWEAKVARDLSDIVFDDVLPNLVQAIAVADAKSGTALDGAHLDDVRKGALILLYRLLFVLYAEDRNLLPDESGAYADYSLTKLRIEVAEKKARGVPISDRMKTYWSRLDGIFEAIGNGHDELGIPPYNGGLFDRNAAGILARIQLPDSVVAETVFRLSHLDVGDGRPPKYINYRDLTVQQLGSVYERILEHGLKVDGDRVVVAENPEARHGSGSYYTPEELVVLIIERAVGPVVAEKLAHFTNKAEELRRDTRPKEARLSELVPLDPASRMLDLRVCDPAMGSGHFLVTLVDWLSDRVLDAMAEASAAVTFDAYVSPLAAKIQSIRARILAEASAHNWPVSAAQLDDRHIVRRMVLKRVVYGVDKNPMAVELAKVALWLHSFTVGAPLSFLDHHLRCGDSVLGAWTRPTVDALRARGALFKTDVISRVEQVARVMERIEEKTDSDIAEVAASKSDFGVVEEATEPVAALFSLLTAEKLMGIFEAAPKKAPLPAEKMAGKPEAAMKRWRRERAAFEAASAFQLALDGTFGGDAMKIAGGQAEIASPELRQLSLMTPEEADTQAHLFPSIGVDDRRRLIADRLVSEARTRAAEHGFFHWEIGFPNVWSNLLSSAPRGGFDAVIGNPPYVRQESLGDDVKRALKGGYSAFNGMADLYVYFYEQGLRLLRPGGRMSYVVTNKWLKAGYAEALRDLFASRSEVEFIADFGHAKHFFPDADVFPSVIAVRKPVPGEPALEKTEVCVIPREAVPEKGLSAAVASATYPLPRAHFTKESWTLEPPDVTALLAKVRRNGVPLAEYIGVKPLNGIKTGLNEAFLIDLTTRDSLVRDDPACTELIRPYLRGQDIERWVSPRTDLFMIVLKSSSDHPWPWADAPDETEAERRFKQAYPSIHAHMKVWEEFLDADSGKVRGLRQREDQGRFWWELRPCAYYRLFARPRLAYQAIQFYPRYSVEREERFGNNKTYFIETSDHFAAACLNSPLGWYVAWRHFIHMKDEALSNDQVKIKEFPIAPVNESRLEAADAAVSALLTLKLQIAGAVMSIQDWLRHEFNLVRSGRALTDPHTLDAEVFLDAVRAALPKSRKWSAADIARLKQEHADTLAPARRAADEVLALERKLSGLVNEAYGLTPEDVALMWRTAPPRMPLDPAAELRRMALPGAGM